MRPIWIIITVLLFSTLYINGQENLGSLYQDYLAVKRQNPEYWNTVRGSAYENKDFSDAVVYLINNPKPEKGKLRYNILFDEMEMQKEGNEEFLIVDRKETIDSILMDDKVYRFMIFEEDKETQKGYFIQLHSGKCKLFQKKSREFQPEKPPSGGYQEYVPASILIKPEKYYVQFEGQNLTQMPQSSKKIITLFRANGINLNDYEKANKIKYSEESLISLLKYCNSL